jgi:hypothetical protein
MAAPRTLITEQELQALAGLPWLAQLLYLTALRPFMAYATGVVGGPEGPKRISLQGLREAVEVQPGPGRQGSGMPSKDQVRRALRHLRQAGLLERLDDPVYLVFRLPMAQADSFVPSKPATESPVFRHPEPATDAAPAESPAASEKRAGPTTEPATESPGGSEAEPATQTETGNRATPLLSTARASSRAHSDEEVPATPWEWAQVFQDRFGYGGYGAGLYNQKALKLFGQWAGQGVSVGTVAACVQAAAEAGTDRPFPTYFAGPVRDALAADVVQLEPARAGDGGRREPAAARGNVNSRWGR